eukprot:7376368-Prymnesium_polylepis.1
MERRQEESCVNGMRVVVNTLVSCRCQTDVRAGIGDFYEGWSGEPTCFSAACMPIDEMSDAHVPMMIEVTNVPKSVRLDAKSCWPTSRGDEFSPMSIITAPKSECTYCRGRAGEYAGGLAVSEADGCGGRTGSNERLPRLPAHLRAEPGVDRVSAERPKNEGELVDIFRVTVGV